VKPEAFFFSQLSVGGIKVFVAWGSIYVLIYQIFYLKVVRKFHLGKVQRPAWEMVPTHFFAPKSKKTPMSFNFVANFRAPSQFWEKKFLFWGGLN